MLPGALLPNRSLRFTCRTSICGSRTTRRSSPAAMPPARRSGCRSRITTAIIPPTRRRSTGWKARAASRSAIAALGRAVGRGQFQRLGARDRRHFQRDPHRARADAAPGKRHRSALGGTDGWPSSRAGGRAAVALSAILAADGLLRWNDGSLERMRASTGTFGGYTASAASHVGVSAAFERRGCRRGERQSRLAEQKEALIRGIPRPWQPRATAVRPSRRRAARPQDDGPAKDRHAEERGGHANVSLAIATGRRARAQRGRVRARLRDPRAHAEPDRARHLFGDVERALLVQIVEGLAAAHCRPRGRA